MTPVRIYKARDGSQLSDEDAQVIGTFVEERFNGNVIHPEDLVQAAKPKRSPIHGYFEWNDTEAARLYRIRSARELLNAIHYVVLSGDKELQTRAFHNVVVLSEDGADRGYVVADIVWQRPDLSSQVIEKARRELVNWSERYRAYSELSGHIEAVEKEVLPLFITE